MLPNTKFPVMINQLYHQSAMFVYRMSSGHG